LLIELLLSSIPPSWICFIHGQLSEQNEVNVEFFFTVAGDSVGIRQPSIKNEFDARLASMRCCPANMLRAVCTSKMTCVREILRVGINLMDCLVKETQTLLTIIDGVISPVFFVQKAKDYPKRG